MAEELGATMTLYSLNKSAKIMQNPEIIAKMVECANITTGADVRQILKVYNYTQNSHRVKIRCDYRIMRTGQIKYNKNITIYKSFNCFNDLMNIILNNNRGLKMFCNKCGRIIEENTKFCGGYGTPVPVQNNVQQNVNITPNFETPNTQANYNVNQNNENYGQAQVNTNYNQPYQNYDNIGNI